METTKKPTTKVIVSSDEAGNVIIPSPNNKEWGCIRVIQNRMTTDENGFVRRVNLSALRPGLIEDLKCFGYEKGQVIEGKIIFKESLTPFDKKNPDRDLKVAGETGITCVQDGAPIYRKNFYTEDEKAIDVTCAHTNKEEIKAAFAALKASSAKL